LHFHRFSYPLHNYYFYTSPRKLTDYSNFNSNPAYYPYSCHDMLTNNSNRMLRGNHFPVPFNPSETNQHNIITPGYSPSSGWGNHLGHHITPEYNRQFVPLPSTIPNVLVAKFVAKDTIESKWNSLGGAPGAAVSDIEQLDTGFRIRYQDGAIYTKKSTGPAFWVHGA
jgi:hypothetical protein